eukprot:m.331551 g.331551  ORF g.331551 m.331551 type:complete len:417 (-) comp16753_c0_seq1:51-1301(-)
MALLKFVVAAACILAASSLPVNHSQAEEWYLISPNPGQLTFAVGVGFTDATTGFIAGGANGAGAEVLKTTDGGKTFNVIPGIQFGVDILLLAAEAAKETVIVTSVFGELYSNDGGKTFKHSIGGGTSQSVRYVGHLGEGDGLHFGIAGAKIAGNQQMVGLTNNGGISFTTYPTGSYTESRYAAFPTNKVFYSASGQFPNPPPPPPAPKDTKMQEIVQPVRRQYRKSAFQDHNGNFMADSWMKAKELQPSGYAAEILKTVDGGQTWQSLFSKNGSFYFNEIDCGTDSTTNCCAAAEAGNESPAAGAYIYCTFDGSTFQEVYSSPSVPGKESFSLMGLEFVSPSEAWACGTEFKQFGVHPLYVHTVDGGKTWTQVEANPDTRGYACLGLDMISPTVGYAAVDNVGRQQAGVAKFGNKV